jgi:hypothetical protein
VAHVIDALEDQAAFDAWLAEQRPVPARAVSLDEMRRWAQAALNERRRRIERQLGKDWRRITPAKAARAVEVGEALIAMLKEMEGGCAARELRPALCGK